MYVSETYTEQFLRSLEMRLAKPRIKTRVKIIRLACSGMSGREISLQVGLSARRVYNWVTRFNQNGLIGLGVKPEIVKAGS